MLINNFIELFSVYNIIFYIRIQIRKTIRAAVCKKEAELTNGVVKEEKSDEDDEDEEDDDEDENEMNKKRSMPVKRKRRRRRRWSSEDDEEEDEVDDDGDDDDYEDYDSDDEDLSEGYLISIMLHNASYFRSMGAVQMKLFYFLLILQYNTNTNIIIVAFYILIDCKLNYSGPYSFIKKTIWCLKSHSMIRNLIILLRT